MSTTTVNVNKTKTTTTERRQFTQNEDNLLKTKTNESTIAHDIFFNNQLVSYLFKYFDLFELYSLSKLNMFWKQQMQRMTNTSQNVDLFT